MVEAFQTVRLTENVSPGDSGRIVHPTAVSLDADNPQAIRVVDLRWRTLHPSVGTVEVRLQTTDEFGFSTEEDGTPMAAFIDRQLHSGRENTGNEGVQSTDETGGDLGAMRGALFAAPYMVYRFFYPSNANEDPLRVGVDVVYEVVDVEYREQHIMYNAVDETGDRDFVEPLYFMEGDAP